MQKLRTNFKFVFDILVGTVFIYMTGTSIQQTLRMTGTSIQRILRMPTKSDSVVRVEGTQQPAGKSVLTDEDIDNIQQGIKPVQFKDEEHHHVGLNVSEGRHHLTAKSMHAFRHVYENYFDKADWFMKADDDTYVIVENLRYFLSGEDPKQPVFFGHHFKTNVKQGYFSGGAGYTLSKEALRRFGEKSSNALICRPDGGFEDVELCKYMQNLGVKAGNSTDVFGRSRFHCFGPETHLQVTYPKWYYKYDTLGANKVTRTTIKSAELAVLERLEKFPIDLQWEKCCEHSGAFFFDWIFFILPGNKDMHISLDEFEF